MRSAGHKLDLAIVQIAVVMVVLAALSLSIRPRDRLPGYPLTEDGYYSLTVSRNIAMGLGVAVEENNRTNGFQPLFTFLCVPAFALAQGDRFVALRYVLFLHLLIYVATAYVMSAIVRDCVPYANIAERSLVSWGTALLYCANIQAFVTHFNGLETGALLLCISLSWRYYQIGPIDEVRGLFRLGLILGLAVLARIDAVLLVMTVSLYQFIRNREESLRTRCIRFAVVAGGALLVSLPWWTYNLVHFDSPIPTSARMTQYWTVSLDRIHWAASVLLRLTLPIHPAPFGPTGDLLRLVLLVTTGAIALAILRSERCPEVTDRRKNALEFGGCLGCAVVLLVIVYALGSLCTYFYARYFAPMILLTTFALGYVLLCAEQKIHGFFAGVTALLAICLICYIALIHAGKISSAAGQSLPYRDQLSLVVKFVPDEEYVAARQSGTLGYFRDRVVNLDGKVNYEAFRLGNDSFLVSRYLRQRAIRWYCDQEPPLSGEAAAKEPWTSVDRQGTYTLFYRGVSRPDDGRQD